MSTTTERMIVVHGGAGSQGRPVVRQLLDDGFSVRVISRDPAGRTYPAGADSVTADLNDADSLVAAYAGADGVYLQLPLEFDPATAAAQAGNALAALERAGVGQVVFNTGLGLTDELVGSPFVDARATLVQRLAGVVPKVTVTGPEQAYVDNFATPFSRAAVLQGRAEYPLPEAAPVAWVAAADVARVVSRAFLSPAPPPIRIVRGSAPITLAPNWPPPSASRRRSSTSPRTRSRGRSPALAPACSATSPTPWCSTTPRSARSPPASPSGSPSPTAPAASPPGTPPTPRPSRSTRPSTRPSTA